MSRLVLVIVALIVFAASVVLAAPALAGGGGCKNTSNVEGAGRGVDMKANCFRAAILKIEPGTTITWDNRDDWDHALNGIGGDWGQNEHVASGDTFSQRFDQPGTYPYYCYIHPGMVGAILVGDAAEVAPALDVSSVETASAATLPALVWLLTGLAAGTTLTVGAWLARSRR